MPHAEPRAFSPTLAQLAPAVVWLRDRHVETRRIAIAFGTTTGHIRVLSHRGRRHHRATSPLLASPPPTVDFPNPAPASDLLPYEGETDLSGRQRAALRQLESDAEAAWVRAEDHWQLRSAVRQFGRLSCRVGRPSNIPLLRARATLRHHQAWSLVHTGFTRSAFVAALRALEDAQAIYRDTFDPVDLRFIRQTALVAAHSQLLRRRPTSAMPFLDMARATSEAASQPLAADYCRQHGVAAFQRGDDDAARVWFVRAAQALIDQEPQRTSLEVQFIGARHIYAISPVNWEAASELLRDVKRAYAPDALQASMMAHWTAAAGLGTDSRTIWAASLDVVDASRPVAARFGHQATINRLLRLTSDLRLSRTLRLEWIRWLLYANAHAER